MRDWCRLRIRQGARGSQSHKLRAFSLALFRFPWHPPVPVIHFHITDRRRDSQPLQMKKCASNQVSPPLVLLLIQPRPLSRDHLARLQWRAEHGESLASVQDDYVVGFCTVRSEERPGTIRMDLVA